MRGKRVVNRTVLRKSLNRRETACLEQRWQGLLDQSVEPVVFRESAYQVERLVPRFKIKGQLESP